MNIVARHWAFFTCRPEPLIETEDDDDDDDDVRDDSSIFSAAPLVEDPPPTIIFPLDEFMSLQNRYEHECLSRQLAHTTIIERPPIACGIVKNIQLLGVFPTSRWLADVTMPPDVKELFGGTPFFALGEYRVASMDILDAAGRLHPLIVIVNKGVEGLLTGYWGAVFGRADPHPCWARFETTGEHETTVKEERYDYDPKSSSSSSSSTMRTRKQVFQEFECLSFSEKYFEEGYAPGTCTTQLERIFGLTAEFLLELEWGDWLPDSLVEKRDTSSKLERKQRAEVATQHETRQLMIDGGMDAASTRKWSKE